MRHAPGRLARSWAAAVLVAGAAVPAASHAQALARPAAPVAGRYAAAVDAEGRRTLSHGGGAVGGSAFLLVYPDQGVVVAMLVNTGDSMVGSGSGARQVARLFLR